MGCSRVHGGMITIVEFVGFSWHFVFKSEPGMLLRLLVILQRSASLNLVGADVAFESSMNLSDGAKVAHEVVYLYNK